jgi:peptidoglycan hydrolase CwlO-like protein
MTWVRGAVRTDIVRRVSPEEEELARKREELAQLQAELAERELFLTNLRAELAAFEGQYLRQVGTLYAELDEWNAKIAEQIAKEEGTEGARSAAAQARTQAEESSTAAHGEAARAQEFTPSAELKTLYREVAKRVHPDLATDEADRRKRELLMAEANAAYQRGDADALRRILEEYESSPESVRGAGVAADLVRAIRQIRQVRSRLSQIELEIASLIDSDIARLRAKTEAARAEGRELLTEMAEDVRKWIDVTRRRFEAGSTSKAKA